MHTQGLTSAAQHGSALCEASDGVRSGDKEGWEENASDSDDDGDGDDIRLVRSLLLRRRYIKRPSGCEALAQPLVCAGIMGRSCRRLSDFPPTEDAS